MNDKQREKILLTEAEHNAVADEYFNQPIPQKYSRRELTAREQARKISTDIGLILHNGFITDWQKILHVNDYLERLWGELDG